MGGWVGGCTTSEVLRLCRTPHCLPEKNASTLSVLRASTTSDSASVRELSSTIGLRLVNAPTSFPDVESCDSEC